MSDSQIMSKQCKYMKGQYVRYKKEVVDEMRKRISGATVGPFPFGRLLIVSNGDIRQDGSILYEYEYGCFGNHEGFALENDLEPYQY